MRSLLGLPLIAFLACNVGSSSSNGDGSAGDSAVSSCDPLDETTCRTTGGCATDVCFTCSCTPSFAGCRASSETTHACPDLGCPPALPCCRTPSDCMSPEVCVAPGEYLPIGPCPQPMPCTTDGDCASLGANWICTTVTDACRGPTLGCVYGCTSDGTCAVGERCLTTHHCAPQSCLKAADCPQDFDCNAGACIRHSCASDGDCHGDYCVKNQCYPGLGMCEVPPG